MSLGLQYDEVVSAAATKPFGFMPFNAGVGVGGHCIPCDPHYLLWQLRRERTAAPVLQRAMEGIAARPSEIVDRAIRDLADEGIAIRGASVMVVGVAYKPGVEDMRESPALEVLERLRASGANVHYTDALIPAVQLHDGVAMVSVADPASIETDLVIVHSMHPGVSHEWLAGRRVLDPSGRSKQRARARPPTRSQRRADRVPGRTQRPAHRTLGRLVRRLARLPVDDVRLDAARPELGDERGRRAGQDGERAPVDREHVPHAQQADGDRGRRPGPS